MTIKTQLNRRTLLAIGGASLATPFITRSALASSGQVRVFTWGEYFDPKIMEAFEASTGIKVNLSFFGSNEEAATKMRASGGTGFDLMFIPVDNRPDFDGLLAEIDETKLKADRVDPALWRSSLNNGAALRGKRFLVPFAWGTEGMTFDSSAHDIAPGELSYGHLWADGMDGKAAVRQKSVLVSLAIYLDSIGELSSNRALDLYKTEEDCRRVFEGCVAFAAKHKKNIGSFWNNATEATTSFTDAGCTIGQTWDTTGFKLHNEVDPKWRYAAPKEGAIGWMDTAAIPSGVENVDQAYELLNFLLTPEMAGMFANHTGSNSAAVGASAQLSDASRAAYEYAYSGNAIENLWWWQTATPWFSEVRQEYVEKLTNA